MQHLVSPFLSLDRRTIPIYILGLKEKQNRIDITFKRLIQAGHKQELIQIRYGIYAKQYPYLLEELAKKWRATSFSKGELACACLHLETLKEVNHPFSMIVEDDLLLPVKWKELFPHLLSTIPQDADIVYLGWSRGQLYLPELRYDVPYIKYIPNCCHCYIISKRAARKIVKNIKKEGISLPIDNWIIGNGQRLGLVIYCANPYYQQFKKYLDGDDTINRSRNICRNGIAYQEESLGSSLEQDRRNRIF